MTQERTSGNGSASRSSNGASDVPGGGSTEHDPPEHATKKVDGGGDALLPTMRVKLNEDTSKRRIWSALSGEKVPPGRFGKYEPIRSLGNGGMGEVFLARDTKLNCNVALKVILRSLAEVEEMQPRLVREARLLAKVRHDNVVVVHDVSTAEGYPYIAMEYVEGPTLRDWLAEAPRAWVDVARVFAAAGAGLVAAHRCGVIHRDFKPENVLVEKSTGRVKVVDFGLAFRHAPALDESRRLAEDSYSFVDQPNARVGTPVYMSPEQWQFEPSDARSDQFSFCVSLFEALFGVRPFEGETLRELTANVVSGRMVAVPPGRRVPEWLLALVKKGLSVDRRHRYASMDEVAAMLDAGAAAGCEEGSVPLAAITRARTAIGDQGAIAIGRNLAAEIHALAGQGVGASPRALDGVLVAPATYAVTLLPPTALGPDSDAGPEERYRLVGAALSAMLQRGGEPGVSRDVRRLLDKLTEPGDGYKSRRGLDRDLSAWLAGAALPRELGADEVDEIFRIPTAILGREPEITRLQAALGRVSTGPSEVVLVSGPSGIGKTALIDAFCERAAGDAAVVIRGKFEQFGSTVPYATLVQALGGLCRALVARSERTRLAWKERVDAAVGSSVGILFDTVPDLEALVDASRDAPSLPPMEAAARFQQALGRLLHAFARPGEPLVVVLDDMQWCDLASLSFIRSTLAGPSEQAQGSHVLWLGAFRDDIDRDRALTLDLLEGPAPPADRRIVLGPVHRAVLDELARDTLGCSAERAEAMARYLQELTLGNPLFVRTLLASLHDQRLLSYSPREECWLFDEDEIRRANLPREIETLVVRMVESLSEPARRLLMAAACLGRDVDRALLKELLHAMGADGDLRSSSIDGAIDECSARGLLSASPGLASSSVRMPDAPLGPPPSAAALSAPHPPLSAPLRFTHDRVQHAARSLLSVDRCAAYNLEIGRILLARSKDPGADPRLFQIVGHLNEGRALASGSLRERIATLDLRAGRRALVANAFAEATELLQVGLSLLPESRWGTHHDLTVDLHLELMQAASLDGKLDEEERIFNLLRARAHRPEHICGVYERKVTLETSRGDRASAIAHGVEGLAKLDESVPRAGNVAVGAIELAKTSALLAKTLYWQRPIDDLCRLNASEEGDRSVAVQRLLVAIGPPAYLTDQHLMGTIVMRIVRRSLQGGLSNVSAYGFVGYGLVLAGILGQYAEGRAYGEVAERLNERFANLSLQPKIDLVNGIFILPWAAPFEACERILARGARQSAENADFAHASYNATSLACVMYYRGAGLETVQAQAVQMKAYTRQARDEDMTAVVEALERTVMCLRGQTDPYDYSSGEWSERAFVAKLTHRALRVAVFFYRAMKVGVLYLHGRADLAHALAKQAEPFADSAFSNPSLAEYLFYSALSAVRAGTRGEARDAIKSAVKRFERWAKHAPENFGARLCLLQAEEARVYGKRDVLHHLTSASELARRHGAPQYEALASELAAEHCFRVGHDRVGDDHLAAAQSAYERWGAVTKAKMMAATPRRSRPVPR